MAQLIELKQTAPERFLARFDTGEEVRTTLAVVTDFHLRSGKELTSPELDALRAASERSRCRQRALRIIGARAMSVKELTDRLKEKGESPENAEDAAMAVRRLGFYARCGAWDTHYTEHLFDAWFRILVLDCPGCASLAPEAVVEALADCYRRTISPTQWQKHVQFFAPDGSVCG